MNNYKHKMIYITIDATLNTYLWIATKSQTLNYVNEL